jgi:hypothetical protein
MRQDPLAKVFSGLVGDFGGWDLFPVQILVRGAKDIAPAYRGKLEMCVTRGPPKITMGLDLGELRV